MLRLMIVKNDSVRSSKMDMEPQGKLNCECGQFQLLFKGILGPFIRGKIRRVLHKTRLK